MSRSTKSKLPADEYFGTYHGHTVTHLEIVHAALKTINPSHSVVFLAGDSSLDSKYWFNDTGPATNGLEKVLEPPYCKQDICHHLNCLMAEQRVPMMCINAAREESTIADRAKSLLPQDKFIRDTITANDILVISLGGNDVALKPSLSTIWAMIMFTKFNTTWRLENAPETAWGFNHMASLFRNGMEDVLKKLTAKTMPKRVVVCHLYYLDEKCGGWADRILRLLGYGKDPKTLQAIIRGIYNHATTKVTIPGTEVVTFPMFLTLDGKTTGDYCMAVEPSAQGNAKLAKALLPILTS